MAYPGKKSELAKDIVFATELKRNESVRIQKDFYVRESQGEINVDFFPEGGDLINGIRSKVAFKATNSEGLGVELTGFIMDGDKKKLVEIGTQHAGMGLFALTPISGKVYNAVVMLDNGTEKTIKLPTAKNEGVR